MSADREALREAVARAIHERRHIGLKNCWPWDDSGLQDEHPTYRDRTYRDADAALAVIIQACQEVAHSWQRADAIKLAAGEMTAHELRTARSVAAGIEGALAAFLPGAKTDAS